MAEKSSIEWTDSTFNPWIGCTKVGPGCDNCYAETRMDTRLHTVKWGSGQERKRTSVHNWRGPATWDKKPFAECTACGWRGEADKVGEACPACGASTHKMAVARRRVFSASLGDWLDNEVPLAWLVDFLDLVRTTPNLDWLLLTKRIGNWRKRLEAAAGFAIANKAPEDLIHWLNAWAWGNPPWNVWVGATVVNQEEADRDIPKLLDAHARVRFLSMEPLLGPVWLPHALHHACTRHPGPLAEDGKCDVCESRGLWACDPGDELQPHEKAPIRRSRVDWVIVGGESGSYARPMHPVWVASLRDQCARAGVPFLFKQWGEWAPDPDITSPAAVADWSAMACTVRIGKRAAGRLVQGKTHDGFPTVIPEPLF